MKAKLVNYLNNDIQYGILIVENASIEEVQKKIREIINKFYNSEFYDWDVSDISRKFPKEWEWNYVSCNVDCVVEI